MKSKPEQYQGPKKTKKQPQPIVALMHNQGKVSALLFEYSPREHLLHSQILRSSTYNIDTVNKNLQLDEASSGILIPISIKEALQLKGQMFHLNKRKQLQPHISDELPDFPELPGVAEVLPNLSTPITAEAFTAAIADAMENTPELEHLKSNKDHLHSVLSAKTHKQRAWLAFNETSNNRVIVPSDLQPLKTSKGALALSALSHQEKPNFTDRATNSKGPNNRER